MKKMRRLIPAVAMLMVAAVMLSTASFAWFTMNEQVTATGMEIQAKAAGNLLISTEKMTAIDQAISVKFTDGKQEISPVTYDEDGTLTSKWIKPADGTKVDPIYGTFNGTMEAVVPGALGNAEDDYFAEYTIYLATAGEEMTNQTLYADINPLAGIDQKIAPAYTIAFYVGDAAEVETPTEVYNYLDFINNGEEKPVLTGLTIPSTYGKDADNAVGLKVVMRIYVDGDLTKETIKVNTNNITNVADATKWAAFKTANAGYADFTFYKDGAEIDPTFWADDFDMTGVSYWNGTTTQKDQLVKYVNNASIPTTSTAFEVLFSVEDTPTPPVQGN